MSDSSHTNASRAEPEQPDDADDVDDIDEFEFDAVPVRRRVDGWTPERQAAFIQALAETACVADACRAIGMSERSAYALRARPEAVSFRNAWDAALDYAIRRLSDAALSRALHGVPKRVFFQGAQIGENRHYDERLTMFLLRYRDPLRYGKHLDRNEHCGHQEGAALALVEATAAVREDAGARTIVEKVKRAGQRLHEIVTGFQQAEQRRRAG
jgi:hypothetical protein